MKIKKFCTVFMLLLGVLLSTVAQAQTYEKMWKQVMQAEKKSLPQTAISLTSEIYRKAQAEKEVPQMLKAYTWRMKYRENLTPDSFFVDLQGIERWATTAEKPVEQAVLHSLISEMIADYAQMNQWEIRGRTDLEEESAPADIAVWSKNLFVNKVLKEVQDALKNAPLLIETSARTYVPFVELGKTSEYYHHDMYHLLAARSIESLGNLRGLGADSLLNARIDAIYGDMLNVYRKPGDVDALVLTTLDYLAWKKETDVKFRPYRAPKGLIGLTQDPYLAGLNKLIAEYGSHDICAEVYLAKAQTAVDGGAPTQGLQLCEQAIAKYPGYGRINALKNLKEDILRPFLTVESPEIIYPDNLFAMRVNHKNLKGFKVNLYKLKLADMPREREEMTPAFLKKNARLLSSVHYDLQVPDHYQAADTVFDVQAPGVGLYAWQVVPDEKPKDNVFRFLSVTRLKMLTRDVPGGQNEVVVLDSKTGQPIADVKVSVYDNKDVLQLTKTTGANGKVVLPRAENDVYLMAAKGDDTAMPIYRGYFNGYGYSETQKPARHTTLLTDRGVYRPGQTVYVKGITYEQYADSAHVVANESAVLTLTDANRQEVGRKELITNKFGSFTAEFVLPTVCLNGEFRLSADRGSAIIRVEEYKRPTFDITFNPVKESYRLGDLVQVQGKAQAYSGMPLQDLLAEYVVSRSVRSWGRWGMAETVLTSDSVRLNSDGGFTIPVKMVPDAAYRGSEATYFEYKVKVSVTNLSGETQTSVTTLTAGERSLILNAQLPELICRDGLAKATFQANNLNLQPVKVDGTYLLYKVSDYVPSKPLKEQKADAEPALTGAFVSNVEMELNGWQSLPSGAYKLVASAKDDQGREVQTEKVVILFSTADKRPPVYSPDWLYVANAEFDAAHPAAFCFGTSEKDAYVMMDLFCGDKWLDSKVLTLSDSIVNFTYPYKEEYGYGLVATFALVKDGQLHVQNVRMTKRLPDNELTMKWDVFRDKLRPGQQEEWKLTIRTPQGKAADAEMLATMYDASLDKIWKRNQGFNLFYHLPLPSPAWRQNYGGRSYFGFWFPGRGWDVPELSYDYFALYPSFGLPYADDNRQVPMPVYARTRGLMAKGAVNEEESSVAMATTMPPVADAVFEEELIPVDQVDGLRTNFAETAFFYPQLHANEQGEVSFTFTVPQSLTTWNFRGYSHTQEMLIGQTDTTAVASKEFMLTPNLPRFVRVGDDTGIAAAVANLTGKDLSGVVKMVLFDPMTDKVISTQKQKFAVKAGETARVNFQFTVTDKQTLLGCRMVADGGTFSDGEQQLIPVLSNKEQITETLPLFVLGDTTRGYSLASLFNNHSASAINRRLTVEFSGNPAWYAVQALPSLAQPQSDNAVSWATAYYANAMSSFIMNRSPRIKTVFDSWKQQGGTKGMLLSNLQKNQEVKSILLQESPWVLQATTEQEQKERLATLFDLNNIANNNRAALSKLRDLQLGSGAWSWYKGMGGSRQLTEYIVELNARLPRLMGKQMDKEAEEMQQAAFGYLHKEALAEYRAMKKAEKEGQKSQGLSAYALKYLYLIAFANEPVPAANKVAFDYFLSKVSATLASQTAVEKAHSVIVLSLNGRSKEAREFIESLKEHLVPMGEGLTIAASNDSYGGLNTSVSNQVAVMDAFQIWADGQQTVEKLKVWLLQQKQTQQWNSPVATASAVSALLSSDMNLLESGGRVRLSLADRVIGTQAQATNVTLGLGYVEKTFTDKKTVNARTITVEKRDAGIGWGAVYAQYEEAVSQVTQQQGSELKIDRTLYVERTVDNVPQLQPIAAETRLSVGDKVVSRMTVGVDRPMDFVQLKEQRAACFEPIESISGYRWSGDAGYYVAVNDASSNFFFDSLNKGVYVLEYSYRVNRTGTYETGLTTVQSAYAPEYASHSASIQVKVE